jgi:hypothetical protein
LSKIDEADASQAVGCKLPLDFCLPTGFAGRTRDGSLFTIWWTARGFSRESVEEPLQGFQTGTELTTDLDGLQSQTPPAVESGCDGFLSAPPPWKEFSRLSEADDLLGQNVDRQLSPFARAQLSLARDPLIPAGRFEWGQLGTRQGRYWNGCSLRGEQDSPAVAWFGLNQLPEFGREFLDASENAFLSNRTLRERGDSAQKGPRKKLTAINVYPGTQAVTRRVVPIPALVEKFEDCITYIVNTFVDFAVVDYRKGFVVEIKTCSAIPSFKMVREFESCRPCFLMGHRLLRPTSEVVPEFSTVRRKTSQETEYRWPIEKSVKNQV